MLGVESCWCCPACNKPKTHPKSRRRERQVSFNSNSLSPSKRQACSLPEQDRTTFPKFTDTCDIDTSDTLEACTNCEKEEAAHLMISLDGGTQIMCLRCQRKKDRTRSLPSSPNTKPDMLATDSILPNGGTDYGAQFLFNGVSI